LRHPVIAVIESLVASCRVRQESVLRSHLSLECVSSYNAVDVATGSTGIDYGVGSLKCERVAIGRKGSLSGSAYNLCNHKQDAESNE
jgi:hypothetical protein